MSAYCSNCNSKMYGDQGYLWCDCGDGDGTYYTRNSREYCPTCGGEMYYDQGYSFCLGRHPDESDKEESKQGMSTSFKKYSEITHPEIKDKLEKGLECSICMELIKSMLKILCKRR